MGANQKKRTNATERWHKSRRSNFLSFIFAIFKVMKYHELLSAGFPMYRHVGRALKIFEIGFSTKGNGIPELLLLENNSAWETSEIGEV